MRLTEVHDYAPAPGSALRHRLKPLSPLALGAVGACISIAAWYAVAVQEKEISKLEFKARAHDVALVLQDAVNDYTGKLAGVRALFQSSRHEMSRAEFSSFTHLLLEKASFVSVSWLPRVSGNVRTAHEAAVARDLAGYHIKAAGAGGLVPATVQNEYFPVLFNSQEKLSSPVYGLNVNDGGIRQQTLERARDENLTAFSSNLVPLTNVARGLNFFLALPVYAPGSPQDTLEERRRNLIGYVQGLFKTSELIETILARTKLADLDLYFFMQDAAPDAAPIHFHPSRMRTGPAKAQPLSALKAKLHASDEIRIADGGWTLIASPAPGGLGMQTQYDSWIVLACGLLITAILMAYLWSSIRHARRLEGANARLDGALVDLNAANEQSTAQNLRFDAALNNMSQGLLMVDASQRIVVCNDRYIEMYGLSRDIVKPGCTLTELFRHRAEVGHLTRDPEAYREAILSEMKKETQANWIIDTGDGREIRIVHRRMQSGPWVVTHEDITEQRAAEAQISHMAHHDALTDLPNRVLFRQRMEAQFSRLGRVQKFAVLCLDLDRFKSVNDALGHPFGDKLLRHVAERIRGCVREGDTVARLGGDEFAVLQGNISEPSEASLLAARLNAAISAPFDLDGHQVVIGVSVGIAFAPSDADDPDQLLKSADMALYRAKSDGRGTYRYFEREMDALMQARRELELDLRRAIAESEFELYYQPLINLKSGKICGFEALLRWNHPTRGLIPPTDFIPLAEETEMIVPIGEWVLRQACLEATKWPAELRVAVNLSTVQFKKRDLADIVSGALADAGLAPKRLEVEITESVLLLNNEATLTTLHQLREIGVRISMDDFGTGYSSLSYLRSFPFDKIKIDRSFVHDLPTSQDSMAIIRAVTGLGASLGMATTAEGVETEEELAHLKREGCTEAQGYLFSRPKPASELPALLEKQASLMQAAA
jgi:diguanylate cyclase (GGDEF)-like protein